MAEFSLEIAGHTARVCSLFESTPLYLGDFVTEKDGEFTVTVTKEDIEFERRDTVQEALEEGFRIRNFPDTYLERACIQRKFADHLLDRDILLLHGSTVAVDGQGYLFTAKSGTGKSTHTRLYRELFGERAVTVNDDKPFLHITPGAVTAYGSPWSGKHGLHTNICVPLKGICLLERGAENEIRRADPNDLVPFLRTQVHRTQDEKSLQKQAKLIDILADTVPLWRMVCNKNREAAFVSYDAMCK